MSESRSSKQPAPSSENSIRVGIIRGEEDLFPEKLLAAINEKSRAEKLNIFADYLMIGGTLTNQACDYVVILDRVSHKLPFLRTILKNSALSGTHIINNPFNDGFYNPFFCLSLASNLGIKIPKTMLLPSRMHPEGTSSKTMRNIIFPLDWQSYFKSVGFPCWLKPALNKTYSENVFVSDNQEFFKVYDSSGNVAFMVQEHLETQDFYHAYYVAGSDVQIVQKSVLTAQSNKKNLSAKHRELMSKATKKLCQALGFEINKVDFAVKNDDLYVIDALNPVPIVEDAFSNEESFQQFVQMVAHLLISKAEEFAAKNKFKKVIQKPFDLIAVS